MGQELKRLLQTGALRAAARQAWTDYRANSATAEPHLGAIACLEAGETEQASSLLVLGNKSLHSWQAVNMLLGLATGKDLPPSFPATLIASVKECPAIETAMFRTLQKLHSRHRWRFARQIDWSSLSIGEDLCHAILVTIWKEDQDLAIDAFFQLASVERAGSRDLLPPPQLVRYETLPRWLAKSEACPARHLLMACMLLDQARSLDERLRNPWPPTPDEYAALSASFQAVAPSLPSVASSYLAGFAHNARQRDDNEQALSLYAQLFEGPFLSDETYKWVRQETLARVRRLVNPASKGGPDEVPTADGYRLMILACVAAGNRVDGILLGAFLTRDHPGDYSAIFAAWTALALRCPGWSQAGFSRLKYIPPGEIAAYPNLPMWPFVGLDSTATLWIKSRREYWPRISIVIPSYQQGRYLEQAILSVINQGYPNVEIIVEDGGSTDETTSILARYGEHLAYVRSSEDNGQSHAIGMGLNRASGELLTWLNSDDMLAPLALFFVADEYLKGYDVVAGACFEFKDGRFVQANLPIAKKGRLIAEELADLKDRWFMGHYFYQPEVFFSASAYRKAGSYIDTKLNFTMDYDLWQRFAKIGATFSKTYWPVALFRRHEQQKTFNLDRTVIEQGSVRRKYVGAMTLPASRRDIIDHARRVLGSDRVKVLVVTGKFGRFFPVELETDLSRFFEGSRWDVSFGPTDHSLLPADADIVVHINTLTPEEWQYVQSLSEQVPRPLIIGWFWDNHHMYMENMNFAAKYDFGIAGHDFARDYLDNKNMMLLGSKLLCYTQWRDESLTTLQAYRHQFERSDDLYGSFVAYQDMPARTHAIQTLKASGRFNQLRVLDAGSRSGYYELSEADKLIDWCSAKVSLCANIERDIPIRFFDALVMGQIPIIPRSALDLPLFKELYPDEDYVVTESLSVADVEQAHAEALRRFDEAGPEGVVLRAERARARHSFASRLSECLALVEAAAHG